MATVLAGVTGVGNAADTPASAPTDATTAVDPAAIEAIGAMSRYLRSLSQYAIDADITKDQVIDGNGKLQFDHELKILFARGKGLSIDSMSAQRHLQYVYDHKQVTLYTPDKKVYVDIAAPAKIGAAMALVEEKYGLTMPLSDIFYWGTDKLPTAGIEAAFFVGPGRVRGQDCRHYAYRQADIDWQLCIANGDQPLPLKLVITTTDVDIQPQYSATLQWQLNPVISADSFSFTPPPDATKISIQPIATATPADGE
jgi:hypothetical protein